MRQIVTVHDIGFELNHVADLRNNVQQRASVFLAAAKIIQAVDMRRVQESTAGP